MELTAFVEFGIVIGMATALAIVASKLRQPAILGYIIAGIIFRATSYFHMDESQFHLFSELGITLLLFVLGLELNLNDLKNLGKTAVIVGLGQSLLTFGLGYLFAMILHFSLQTSLYIALGLTFSSTIIVIKLLSLKKDLDALYGKISIGIMLIQDFLAIAVLIGLSAFGSAGGEAKNASFLVDQLSVTLLKGVLVVIGIYLFVRFILYPLLDWIRSEKEILFFTVISWALLLAALMGSKSVGFSLEVGGLIAGIALSSRFEHLQIQSWTKPLRDLFLMLFFIMLGLQIDVSVINEIILPAILLSVFIIVVKPLLVLFIMKLLGYSRKVSFMTAITIAQVSEFGLIVANFGISLGHIDHKMLTLLTLVGGITMTFSSYMIIYNDKLLDIFTNIFKNIHFNNADTEQIILSSDSNIILFGCHRMGKNLLKSLHKKKKELLVIDIDPDIVRDLRKEGFNSLYGDIGDVELYEEFGLQNARIIISTVPSLKENKRLLHFIKNKMEYRPLAIIYANDEHSTKELYEAGADFVIYPHLIGSQILSNIISKGILSKNAVKLRGWMIEVLGM